MTTRPQTLESGREERATTRAVAHRLRGVAAARIEEALAELPTIARRVRTLLLVLSIAIPVFLIAVVAILWHLAS